MGALSSRAVGIPRRLDESLERLEQGDLQLQIRMGESDRQFRRMVTAQQSIGQSVLLGGLAVAAALMGASARPLWALLPLGASVPVGMGWLKLQVKLRKDARLESLSSAQR